jgi:hypothetical protein
MTLRSSILVALLTIALFAGLASTSARHEAAKIAAAKAEFEAELESCIGLTMHQVIEIYGLPTHINRAGNGQILIWSEIVQKQKDGVLVPTSRGFTFTVDAGGIVYRWSHRGYFD